VRRSLALIGALLVSTVAHAEIQKTGPEIWPSKHELSAHMGYHLGFGQQVGDSAGLKLVADYGYRFHRILWFDVQLNQVFGFGPRDGPCLNNTAALCYRGGWSTQFAAGIKVKIELSKVPLVIEVPILLGLTGMYNRECGDEGVAIPVVRTGAGLKYFIKQRFGLGAAINVDLGPAFHEATACKGGGRYTDFYGGVDILLGAEFIL